jgi:phosphate transport system substrate-binding protein
MTDEPGKTLKAGAAPSREGISRIDVAPPDLARANPMMWGLLVLVVLGLGTAALVIVQGIERGPQPPFLVKPPVSRTAAPTRREANLLRLAGSGSNLPVTRALADAFAANHPDARVIVHASIGSAGGVRAAHDGAIDVGLISRDLKPHEQELGLRHVPYARTAVVFAVNPNVPVDGVTRGDVLAIYSGRRERWPDGTPVVVLQREQGDSSHLAAATAIDGFREVDRESLDTRRWRVLFRDTAMHEALVSTSGAIGLIDLGAAVSGELKLRVLSLDGVQASELTVSSGDYPMAKPLGFVLPTDAGEVANAFINFVFSTGGREIIRRNGYIPLDGGAQ